MPRHLKRGVDASAMIDIHRFAKWFAQSPRFRWLPRAGTKLDEFTRILSSPIPSSTIGPPKADHP